MHSEPTEVHGRSYSDKVPAPDARPLPLMLAAHLSGLSPRPDSKAWVGYPTHSARNLCRPYYRADCSRAKGARTSASREREGDAQGQLLSDK